MPSWTTRVRVAFTDVDASQGVSLVAMGRYFEEAERELMRSLGVAYTTSLFGLAAPRVHVACDFEAMACFDDQLDVEAQVERVGTSSWSVALSARFAEVAERRPEATPGQVVASGRMVIVTMHPESERATPLPAPLREVLARA